MRNIITYDLDHVKNRIICIFFIIVEKTLIIILANLLQKLTKIHSLTEFKLN
jgi:hypothetical protein